MYLEQPLFIENVEALRKEILETEKGDSKRAQLWNLMKRCARTAPLSFPWYTPAVALITQDPEDIERAKMVLGLYLQKLEPMSHCSGMQFHFWCFAFPHAKWATYFQWLCTMDAFSEAERKEISEQFLSYQFVNFYYGMNTKPEPECVDNQTLSLALSCTLIGYLFSQGEEDGIANLLFRDGLRRLPTIIGAMPKSGYSGEGSTYMDCVNGPAIPISIELLSLITGEKDLLNKAFAPNQCRPIKVLESVAREWMPGGLLLPWDSYGYQYGTRSAMAYGASKTGKAEFFDVLENKCVWSNDVGIGWAYDDLAWTLIWWPVREHGVKEKNWYDPEVGGILESEDSNRYLMQMWDDTAVGMPARMHVNPNAVLFNGYGIPLSADGTKNADACTRFCFEDTYREVGFLNIGQKDRYNYGDGCAGAHSVVLIDSWEGMRVKKEHPQVQESGADLENGMVYGDVTPVYQEHWEDIDKVARKSSYHKNKFFTVEDLVKAKKSHQITSRFLLRPDFTESSQGVKIETPEGVTLHIVDALGCENIHTEIVDQFPKQPDGVCGLADFISEGTEGRRLFVAFISRVRKIEEKVKKIACISDPDQSYSYEEAVERLKNPQAYVELDLPAYMEAELPVHARWWYQKKITKKRGEAYLVLPRAAHNPALWINDQPIDISKFSTSGFLLQPHVRIPEQFWQEEAITVVFRTDVATSHYDDGNENGMTVSINGGMALAYPCEEEKLESVLYTDGELCVRTNQDTYVVDYKLMEE